MRYSPVRVRFPPLSNRHFLTPTDPHFPLSNREEEVAQAHLRFDSRPRPHYHDEYRQVGTTQKLALFHRYAAAAEDAKLAAAPMSVSFDVLQKRDEEKQVAAFRRQEAEISRRKRVEWLERREKQTDLKLGLDRQVQEKQARLVHQREIEKVYGQQVASRMEQGRKAEISRLRSERRLKSDYFVNPPYRARY